MTKLVNGRLVDEDGVIHEPQGEDLSEARLVAMLAPLYRAKRDAAGAQRAYDGAKRPIRDWLGKHPMEKLTDGETGITAYLQHPETLGVDLVNMPDAVVLWAARAGVLALDTTAWKALKDKAIQEADLFRRFVFPGEGTPRLQVERKERIDG